MVAFACSNPADDDALPEAKDIHAADIDLSFDAGGGGPEMLPHAKTTFDPFGAHKVEISVSKAIWTTILKNAENVDLQRIYHKGDVRIDGVQYKGVGFKNFGDGSQSGWWKKPNIRVKFNKFDDKNYGPAKLRNIRLKASGGDHSFLREPFTYELTRGLGGYAPRFSFARVFVNGEFYGLYQVLEHIDKRFFKHRFGNKDGLAFDPASSCYGLRCPSKGCADIAKKYEIEPLNGSFAKLIAAADAIKNAPDAQLEAKLSKVVNMEQLLIVYAVDATAADVDGFMATGANFELYENQTDGLLNVFRHGADSTFNDIVDFETPWPDPNKLCGSHVDPFWSRAWKHKTLGPKLKAKLRKLHCDLLLPKKVSAFFARYAYPITNELINDPHGMYDPKPEVFNEITHIKAWIHERRFQLDKVLGKCP